MSQYPSPESIMLQEFYTQFKKPIIGALIILAAGGGFWWLNTPHSYEECILEYMPNTSNIAVARSISRACRSKFPD